MRHLPQLKRFGAGIALFVAGLVFFGFAVYEFNVGRKLKRDAVQGDAVITDKRETKDSKGRTQQRVDLRFVDSAGREHTMTRFSSDLWRKSIGDTVPIAFCTAILPPSASSVKTTLADTSWGACS